MSAFVPSSWPEEPVPTCFEGCKECGLYTHGTRMVWGEGNPEAAIMVILDNPGSREDCDGNSFVCGTRQTLQIAANEVGLTANDLYTTYILKRKPTKPYDKESARKICMNHLEDQLQEKKHKLIFCMGNVAIQSFFQNPDADVKSLRGSIRHVKGFQTLVAYHPLAVRRQPNLWPFFIKDWKDLAELYLLNKK